MLSKGDIPRKRDVLRPYKRAFILVLIFGIGTDAIALSYPLLLQKLLDSLTSGMPWHFGSSLVLTILALTFASVSTAILRDYFSASLSTQLDRGLSSLIITKALNLPLFKMQQRSSGDWLVALQQVQDVKTSLGTMGTQAVFALLLTIGYSAILWQYDQATFFAYIAIATATLGSLLAISKRTYGCVTEGFAQKSHAETIAAEFLKYALLIRSFRLESWLKKRWSIPYDKSIASFRRADLICAFCTAFFDWFRQTAPLLVLLWKFPQIQAGQISLGTVIAMSLIVGQGFEPLLRVSFFFASLQKARLGLNNICAISGSGDKPEVLESGHRELNEFERHPLGTTPKPASLCLTKLCFNFGTKARGLRNIDLKVKAGERVALVGSSGAGKSTLLQVILGLIEAQSGEVILDGKPLTSIPTPILRRSIAMVTHDPALISGTLLENIALGDTQPDKAWVASCLQLAQAANFVQRLSDGLQTMVGDGAMAVRLSAGETQRIALARALYQRPRLLLLDEPTSALDALSEQAFIKTLTHLDFPCTLIASAHRLTSVASFDRIYVMHHGQIVESGDHQALLKKQGFYARLWSTNTQLQGPPRFVTASSTRPSTSLN